MSRHPPIILALLTVLLALGKTLVIPQKESRRLSVLFFGAPTSHHPGHDPITRYRVIKKHLGIEGIDFTYTEDPAVAFSPETLARHDALLMYGNWEQHGELPKAQEKALLDFVNSGGGFLPIHCASACYGKSPAFVKLVGARFKSHGAEIFSPRITHATHPITQNLKPLQAWDETYVHDQHADDLTILQKRTTNRGRGRASRAKAASFTPPPATTTGFGIRKIFTTS